MDFFFSQLLTHKIANPAYVHGSMRQVYEFICDLLSFYASMQKAGIQPEINLPERPVWRVLDSGAVSRVFANIIGNAIKYSGGDLSVSMDEGGCVCFSNAAPDLNTVAVGRLFDRFYTVEASRNSTGLGLSIARLLTERMGGSIRAGYVDGRLEIMLRFD